MFVIVDITKPRSVPQEVQATVPDYQRPFIPIMEEGEESYSMFRDIMMYDWVLKPLITYRSRETLLHHFKSVVIDRAWNKHKELQLRKSEVLQTVSMEEFVRSSKTANQLADSE